MPVVRYACGSGVYWAGELSRCYVNGDIERYVEDSSKRHTLPLSVLFTQSDGWIAADEEYTTLEMAKLPGTYPIVAALCSRRMNRHNMIHLPLDDATFRFGLRKVLDSVVKPKWEDRLPCAFWRGGASGIDRPTLRAHVTRTLFGHPNTDVRITKWGNWENGHDIPEEHFGNRVDLSTHCLHKYILIVDGNCIASSHQWVFGSGSVPIMITHPDNKYWFQDHLKPMVNYVPIRYDLSDLQEKIDWLVAHDDEAREIAKQAVLLSDTIFTPEFQRAHIDSEINRVLYGNTSMLEMRYREKSNEPSDINEHLPTLYQYAQRCSTIVECGVRSITSSYAFARGLVGTVNNSLTMIDVYESENMSPFLALCKEAGVNAKFICASDTECDLIHTDMLFIDTWHVYAHLRRELAYWHSAVRKYIILHDTTVDADFGETIRCGLDAVAQSLSSGYPIEEIRRGLWPAVTEFLQEHPEWTLEHRYTNNNGLTVLRRV